MQEFFINQHSVNPTLRMELVCDGKYDYKKSYIYNKSIQNAQVTFSMINKENGVMKISKSPSEIVLSANSGCEDKYLLQYTWKERDVKDKGVYRGWFEINFNGDIYQDGIDFPSGNLIVPIEEELQIIIK